MKISNISNYSNMSESVSKSSADSNVEVSSVNAPSVKAPVNLDPVHNMQQETDDKAIDENLLQKSVDQANKNLQQFNRVIQREVHEVTHAVMYKLVDSTTNEVISEFPPKKIQDMIAKMWELAGLFVDEKA